MSLFNSLRRTALGLAATAMVVGGTVGFVAAASTAGATDGVSSPLSVNTILLHNNTAATGTDCPNDGLAYWHFVLAPNNTYTITLISLDLGTEVKTFSGAAIVKNGVQTDNVFVAVPAGHTLTDLVLGSNSFAQYTGGESPPNNFNLSHVCAGTISTTTTQPTTTTTQPTTTTTQPTTTTTEVEVLGTVQTTSTTVAGAVQATGELPYTGSDTAGMVAAGMAVLLGGALLVGLARTKGRDLGEQ